jgi:hypothetical protein
MKKMNETEKYQKNEAVTLFLPNITLCPIEKLLSVTWPYVVCFVVSFSVAYSPL